MYVLDKHIGMTNVKQTDLALWVFRHVSLKADSHITCRTHAVPLPCRALIHICHAAPLPCSDSAVSFVNVRMVDGNIRLLVQQCNRSSFL